MIATAAALHYAFTVNLTIRTSLLNCCQAITLGISENPQR